jgi:hypothetical protein
MLDKLHGTGATTRLGSPLWLGAQLLLNACVYDWKVVDEERPTDAAPDTEIAWWSDAGDNEELDAASAEPDAGPMHVDVAQQGTLDASPDAEPAVDAGVGFCARVDAAFCADFEDGTLDAFSWQELTTTSQASLSVVEADAGGLALKSAITGAAEESARVAWWLADAAPSWLHAAFDFLPQLSLPDGGSLVFWFKLSEQTGAYFPGVGLASGFRGTVLAVHNFDGTTDTFDLYPVADLPGGWVHVDVAIAFGASGSITVRFNDSVAATYTGPVHVANVTQSYLQLGVYSQQTPASWALYDNIVVEFEP